MNVSTVQRLILFKQSLFALPWVLAACALALLNPIAFLQLRLLFLIPFAFFAARTAGMAFNRIIDREIDEVNPRTKDRLIPVGEVSLFQAHLLAWGSLTLFILSLALINSLLFYLSPFIAALLFGYSYTKRFTPFAHFVLGLIQFCAPVFAWVAVTGSLTWAPVYLGFALFFSISANDIIYAIQDLDFDRKIGLYSLPVCLGKDRSILLSRILQFSALISLIALGNSMSLGLIWGGTVVLCSGIYLYSQKKLDLSDSKSLFTQFTQCNNRVAFVVLGGAVGEFLWVTIY